MIGVLAFVVTPAFFLPLLLGSALDFAARNQPAALDALTRLLATIFLSYSGVAIGVIAAFEWDALAFDRRDAMVLGPLPIPGRAIVAAKAAALAALLFIVAGCINVLTAVTFSLVATSNQGIVATGRLFVAHVLATTAAAVFVFCSLVTIRSAVGLLGRGRVVVGSLLQFALVSALLCFFLFAPTAVTLEFPRRADATQMVRMHMQTIPAWSPTRWFAALYDELRGTAPAAEARQALVAIALVIGSVFAALASIMAGYRHQLRLALTPSAAPRVVAGARLPRAAARVLAGRSRPARAIADFIVVTLARSRAQQAPIAMNAAIAVVMIVLDVYQRRGEIAAVLHLSVVMSPLPLLGAFWVAVGFRASFFVPSELPAAWTFRMNAVNVSSVRHAAIRGAMGAMLVPAAAACAVILSARLTWLEMIRNASFVALAVIVLIELLASTVAFTPYTRPYEPGHAKLKTRWPLYIIGACAFAYGLVAVERACWTSPSRFTGLLTGLAALAVTIDLAGRARRPSPMDAIEELVGADGRMAVLGIGAIGLRRR